MTGIDIIKKFEGCKLKAYLCPAGIPTIGYGHTYGVKLDRTITQDQANILLEQDYQDALNGVEELIKVPLSENQIGALASFVFNLGRGKLLGSTLRKKLNQGDSKGAAEEFDKWVFSKGVKLNGLIARRAAEKALFESES